MTDKRDAPTLPPNRPAHLGGTSESETTAETVVIAPSQSPVADTTAPNRFGGYELLDEIARGGMGVVYKARQTSLQRTVALKMILDGHLASDDDVRRFRLEAEAAAKLDHPSIVPIYDVGEHEGRHYYAMAYVKGESLADLLHEGPLPPFESAEAVAGAARAVDHAHQHGVVHRDLKPANILLDDRGNPRIIDFGLAKQLAVDGNLTSAGQVMGTPNYMAPEQAAGKTDQVGPAADIYSLGAILYALLTGRPPFNAASTLDTMLQVLEQVPVSPRRLNLAVARDLETIVMKCLEKTPARRYDSAATLAEDLDRYLAGKPILAKPPGIFERCQNWIRNHVMVTSVSTGLAVVLMVLALLTAFSYRREWRRKSQLLEQIAELEETVEQDRAKVQQERLLRLEAHERSRRNEALRLAAEARLIITQSPDLSVLLAIEAIEIVGDSSGLAKTQLRSTLLALLEAYQTVQDRSSDNDSVVMKWSTLSISDLVALARATVGRSLSSAERERFLLNEPT